MPWHGLISPILESQKPRICACEQFWLYMWEAASARVLLGLTSIWCLGICQCQADGAYTVHYPKHFVSCRAGSVFRRLQDADMENPMCLFEKSFRLCLTCKCLCMRVCGYSNSENSLQVMEEMHRSEQVCNTKLAIAKTPWQAETVSKSKSQVLRSSLTETQKRCQVPFKLHMHSEVTDFSDLEFGSIIFLVVFRSFFVFCPIIFTCHHMWSCVIPLAASNT